MSLGEAFPILWLNLYAAGGDPIPVELFHRLVREAVNERFGCVVDDLAGDVEQRLWRRDVAALLDTLELLGAVHLGESLDHAEHENIVEHASRDDPDPTLIPLTPIGLSAWPWPGQATPLDAAGCPVGRSITWPVIGSMRQRAYSLTLRGSST